MHAIDITIIVLYVFANVGIGFYLARRAGKSFDNYFLGGRTLPWWVLGLSGGATNFDLVGTMWIVSIFYAYGVKGMWVMWMFGLPQAAFFMAYLGKYSRRAGVMTGAEWLEFRFGNDTAGRAARLSNAIFVMLFMVLGLGYLAAGLGKFSAYFLPYSPTVCAMSLLLLTGIYVIVGGVFGVAVTDIFQSAMMVIATVGLGLFCLGRIDLEFLHNAVPADWFNFIPPWKTGNSGDVFHLFGIWCILWIFKAIIGMAGGPLHYDFQRYLAAKSARDASKIGMMWGFVAIPRFLMNMAFVVLAILAFGATIKDPEQALPMVVNILPIGLKGLLLAGLISAFMSTYDSSINCIASFWMRDIYQGIINPKASEKKLVSMSQWCSAFIVLLGASMALFFENIAPIWYWMVFSFSAGIIVPHILRFHWWRFNGWGYTIGVLGTLAFATAHFILKQSGIVTAYTEDYYVWPALFVINAALTIAATLLTRPTDRQVLKEFYRKIVPMGAWGPIAGESLEDPFVIREKTRWPFDIVNVMIGIPWIIALYMIPVYWVIGLKYQLWLSILIATGLSILLYFTWYRNLPED